jgi:hypothetical protein
MIESQSLRQKNALFINTHENSSITLTCEIESSRMNENVQWHYFQLDQNNQIINKFQLNTQNKRAFLNNDLKLQKKFYSHLNLYNVTLNNSGYYSCSIQTMIKDDLNQSLVVRANSTYFLQVQCKFFKYFLFSYNLT